MRKREEIIVDVVFDFLHFWLKRKNLNLDEAIKFYKLSKEKNVETDK